MPSSDLPTSTDAPLIQSRAAPRVSIGLPVYQGANYVALAVDSILAQSFTDFELIICDNASSDATEEICRHYAQHDGRIRYIRHAHNIGGSANHNHAFKLARGTYFKWAGHDDVMAPDLLQDCVAAMDRNPQCILSHSATVLIDEDGASTTCYADHFASMYSDPVKRFAVWMRYPTGLCNPIYGLMRKSELEKTTLMGNYIGSDRILLGEIALRGTSIAIPKGHFQRRLHSKMSTRVNRNALRLSQWFSGGSVSGLRFKRWRQLGEFMAMIRRIETLTFQEKRRAMGLVVLWMAALRGEFLKELMLPLYVNGQDTSLKRLLRNAGQS